MEIVIALAFLGCVAAAIVLIILAVARKPGKREAAIALVGCFVLMVVAAGISGASGNTTASVQKPTATPRATQTPTLAPTPPPTFEELRASAIVVAYDTMFRDIESYIGSKVYYRGKAVQVVDNGKGSYTLRVNVTPGVYGIWNDDILLHYYGSRLLEDDIIEFVGVVKGPYTYRAVLGNERTIPELTAIQLRLAK